MTTNRREYSWGVVALLASTLCYGLYGVLTRLIGLAFGIFSQATARGAIKLLLLGAYLSWTRGWRMIERRAWGWLILMGLFGTAAYLFIFLAFNKIPIGTVLFTFYTSVVLTGYAVGRLAFGERLPALAWVTLALSLVGLAFIYGDLTAGGGRWLWLVLLSGAFSTLWSAVAKRLTATYAVSLVVFYDELIATFFTALGLVLAGELALGGRPSGAWVAVAVLAAVTVAGNVLNVVGFRRLPVRLASLTMLTEVLFGLLFAWLFFSEVPTAAAGVGGAFILAAIAVSHYVPPSRVALS